MRISQWRELCADAKRLRITVNEHHFNTISHYMRTRRVSYSPEFIKMYDPFHRNRGVLYAYWDILDNLYKALVLTGENYITRLLSLTSDRERIQYGYAIPATLGADVIPHNKRQWIVRQIHRHPLLLNEWVAAAAAYAYDPSKSIGHHLLCQS